MTPPRSKAHLAFIRSLPCVVCKRTRNVEAAHAPGSRGMAQKRSDFETLPLCRLHHQEQHRIGWTQFIRSYELDVQWWLEQLRERPKMFLQDSYRMTTGTVFYYCSYRHHIQHLCEVRSGVSEAWRIAQQRCREILIAELFDQDNAA